jgi:transketolase
VVPPEVRDAYANITARAKHSHDQWKDLFAAYTAAFPDLAADYVRRFNGELPADWEKSLPTYSDAVSPLSDWCSVRYTPGLIVFWCFGWSTVG